MEYHFHVNSNKPLVDGSPEENETNVDIKMEVSYMTSLEIFIRKNSENSGVIVSPEVYFISYRGQSHCMAYTKVCYGTLKVVNCVKQTG